MVDYSIRVTCMKYADVDRIYQTMPLDSIPWNSETPPDALVNLIQNGIVQPCRTVDLGCGAGNYAIYLAGLGFDVTGVDSSPTAIKIAGKNTKKRGARCRFIVADLLGDLHEVTDTFDFAYDWEFLHHIFPEDREAYIRNVYKITNPGATYFSVCFAESDPQFGGSGKYRTTRIGTTLYFSSESELMDLVSPYFTIRKLKTMDVSSKFGPHRAVCVLATRH
ncbi:class I SAM-dependent methyltransferase [Methanoregula sp.]|jgi:SAM-dependent methyltransferase|uniref:class I SAM-dependent methyltransferase n=1 Tax=Methanoregula sp. TaxID=2052170 RepID=UPI0025DFFC06|nr:class I SAM-dependent methyltransferase [Methanoregula sp.]